MTPEVTHPVMGACLVVSGFLEGDNMHFRLTPPKRITFFFSVALAIIAVVLRVMAMKHVVPTGGYLLLLAAYLVLLAGNLFEGI